MKKIKFFIAIVLSVALLLLTACTKYTLEAPVGFNIDDSYLLTWASNDDVRSYTIEITGVQSGVSTQDTTRRASYSLAGLDEGDYSIRVKAYGGSTKEPVESDWSESIEFHKDYESGLIYTLINGNAEYQITSVGSAAGELSIEDYYRNKPVTSIAEKAFSNNQKVEKIIVGNRVTNIGSRAFYNCSKLTSVVIPDSVTSIGDSAFHSCRSLTEITLSENLGSIEQLTFAYCRALENIVFPENLQTIGQSAFIGCSSLQKLTVPDSVTTIEESAFEGCTALTEVRFGDGLESIGDSAFASCSALQDINFGEQGRLSSIGTRAFYGCSELITVVLPEGLQEIGGYCFNSAEHLKSVSIPESVTSVGRNCFNGTEIYASQYASGYIYADKWLVACTEEIRTALVHLESGTLKSDTFGIADYVFTSCEKLEDVAVSDSLKIIGNYSFSKNLLLKRVDTPDGSVREMGVGCFYGCEQLDRIFFGTGLETIGSCAFYGCSSLDNNTFEGNTIIPSTVTSIGLWAFLGTKLWDSPDEYGVVYAGNWVVGYNSDSISDVQLNIDESLEGGGISDYAFYNCETLQNISGVAKFKNIGVAAFWGCDMLTSVSLNRDLRKIESYTFFGCPSLFNVSFPSRLKEIDDYAFSFCTGLSSIDLSETDVTRIGDYAFYNCSNVKTLQFNTSDSLLETIGSHAFYNCSSVKELVIPDSVLTIGERSFSKCSEIESLTLGSGLREIPEYAFNKCYALKEVSIPDNIETIGDYAFYNCSGLERLTLGKGLKTIGDYAFAGAEKLSVLVFPEELSGIGAAAFKDCSGLTSIILNDGVEHIGTNAFYGCSKMSVYTSVGSVPDGWNGRWNASYRPVIYNCILDEENLYVVSVTIAENGIANSVSTEPIKGPVRSGYVFVGWATDPDSQTAEYAADALPDAPVGTVLYAVWIEDTGTDEPEIDVPETEETPEDDVEKAFL